MLEEGAKGDEAGAPCAWAMVGVLLEAASAWVGIWGPLGLAVRSATWPVGLAEVECPSGLG